MARPWRRKLGSSSRSLGWNPATRRGAPAVRVATSLQAEVVLLDGKLVPAEEAVLSVFDRGVLYGESLFETLKVVDEAPCLWEAHRDRLAAGCAELGLPVDMEALERGVRRLLLARPVAYGSLRLQVTGGVQPGGGRGLTARPEGRWPRTVGLLYETAPYPSDLYSSGAQVVSCEGLRRSLPWLKSGSFLASVQAKTRAEQTGAFECLLTEGDPRELLEGSFTNLLLWEGQALVTPPRGRVLPGVTLSTVLEVARQLDVPVREAPVMLPDLSGNGLLLTSSLLGVCHCATLDGRPLVPLRSLATRLQDGLRLREEASVARWQEAEGGPRSHR